MKKLKKYSNIIIEILIIIAFALLLLGIAFSIAGQPITSFILNIVAGIIAVIVAIILFILKWKELFYGKNI